MTVSVEGGRTVVRAMYPRSVLGLVAVPALAPVGQEALLKICSIVCEGVERGAREKAVAILGRPGGER